MVEMNAQTHVFAKVAKFLPTVKVARTIAGAMEGVGIGLAVAQAARKTTTLISRLDETFTYRSKNHTHGKTTLANK